MQLKAGRGQIGDSGQQGQKEINRIIDEEEAIHQRSQPNDETNEGVDWIACQ